MGNQKQKWTAEEEEALLAGVAKHGAGKWKNILKDDEFAPFLIHRSNIDLKDKWRNLSVSTSGHGSKERTRGPKIRNIVAANVQNSAASAHVQNSAAHTNVHNSAAQANVQNSAAHANVQNSAPHANVQKSASHANVQNSAPHVHNSAPAVSVRPNASPDAVMNDASNSAPDAKMGKRYNAMIFEALSTLKDMNGSDIGAILNFMEQSHEVPIPPNFRKALGARLRKLIHQGKLERGQNGYKLKEDASLGTKTPIPTLKHKDAGPQQLQNSPSKTSAETVQDAADMAAYKVVDAENKTFLAVEAMKEAERISKMAEDTESMLQLMKEIYEQCSFGEVVALA